MRALLTPEIAPRMGVVLLRPGADLMPMFRRGRVLIEPAPEKYSDYATGAIPPATQPLAEDPVLKPVFENKDVILRAGGISSLEAELERRFECQYPHGSWHSENFTLFRHEPGSIRLCWACDNLLRDQYTETLAGIARGNWYLADNGHPLTAGVQRRPSTDDPGVVLVAGDKQSGARHP